MNFDLNFDLLLDRIKMFALYSYMSWDSTVGIATESVSIHHKRAVFCPFATAYPNWLSDSLSPISGLSRTKYEYSVLAMKLSSTVGVSTVAL
jgi:hypothetical protein